MVNYPNFTSKIFIFVKFMIMWNYNIWNNKTKPIKPGMGSFLFKRCFNLILDCRMKCNLNEVKKISFHSQSFIQ